MATPCRAIGPTATIRRMHQLVEQALSGWTDQAGTPWECSPAQRDWIRECMRAIRAEAAELLGHYAEAAEANGKGAQGK